MSGYERIKKIADRLGWPEAYRRDLEYHDRNALENYDGEFLWSVRSTGTHLQRRDHLCAEAQDARGWRNFGSAWRDVVGGRNNPDARSFLCDARGCHEITSKPARVAEIMHRWMADCKATPFRIREVLGGTRQKSKMRRARG